MADEFGARKDGEYLVVTFVPDVCGVPPVPPVPPVPAGGAEAGAGEAGGEAGEAAAGGELGGNTPGEGATDMSVPPPPPVPASLPTPFGLVEPLSLSVEYAKTVRFNGNFVVMLKSFTDPTEVPAEAEGIDATGLPESGLMTGMISGTTGQIAEPIEHSLTFKVEQDNVVRVGDLFFMNTQNTLGKLVFTPAPQEGVIEENGAINV